MTPPIPSALLDLLKRQLANERSPKARTTVIGLKNLALLLAAAEKSERYRKALEVLSKGNRSPGVLKIAQEALKGED